MATPRTQPGRVRPLTVPAADPALFGQLWLHPGHRAANGCASRPILPHPAQGSVLPDFEDPLEMLLSAILSRTPIAVTE